MLEAKPVSTPMASSTNLSAYEGEPFPNHTLLRSTVGALQYLSITRPDIAFAVNKLSQFMHKLTQTHWQSVNAFSDISRAPSNLDYKFIALPVICFKLSVMLIGQVIRMIAVPLVASVSFLARI